MQNVRRLCAPLANIMINSYRDPTELFIDGDVLLSREGTTQGDPLAMPIYSIATVPLIRRLDQNVMQVWYADDATGVGKISNLRNLWNQICEIGPGYGYFPNETKTWLVTKAAHYFEAVTAFARTDVKITSKGRLHLGTAIGAAEFRQQFAASKVDIWCKEIEALTSVVQTQPHAAFAAFTNGIAEKWSFLSRTVPDIKLELQPLEDIIRTKFIHTLTRHPPPNDSKRELFALPERLGGMGLINPAQRADLEHQASIKVTSPLSHSILSQQPSYTSDVMTS